MLIPPLAPIFSLCLHALLAATSIKVNTTQQTHSKNILALFVVCTFFFLFKKKSKTAFFAVFLRDLPVHTVEVQLEGKGDEG